MLFPGTPEAAGLFLEFSRTPRLGSHVKAIVGFGTANGQRSVCAYFEGYCAPTVGQVRVKMRHNAYCPFGRSFIWRAGTTARHQGDVGLTPVAGRMPLADFETHAGRTGA